MNEPLVHCTRISKRFSGVVAADDVSFSLQPGEILSILGPSGCGKTTLLRLIAGFETVDSGEITIQGRLVSAESIHEPPDRRNVGMVFQEYALFPHMTVAQNISFGLDRLSKRERRRRLGELLELVQLTGLDKRYPHELSGGQQQRVALARTLAPRPITILLDEPFSNLDAGMRSEVRHEIEAILRENNIATMFVTHDRDEAFAMADRIGVMTEGRLHQMDTPDAIYNHPVSPTVAQLTSTCDFLDGCVKSGITTTEVGELPCASDSDKGGFDEGTDVTLLVHPEDFRVEADESGDHVVRSREFRGDETMLVVEMPSGASVRCRQRSYSKLTPGTRVRLSPVRESPFLTFRKSE